MANTKEFLEISQVKTAIATTSFSFSLKRFSFKEEEKNFAHNFIWRTYAFWWTIEFIWIYFVVFGRLHFYTKRANEREYSFDYYSLLMVFFGGGGDKYANWCENFCPSSVEKKRSRAVLEQWTRTMMDCHFGVISARFGSSESCFWSRKNNTNNRKLNKQTKYLIKCRQTTYFLVHIFIFISSNDCRQFN